MSAQSNATAARIRTVEELARTDDLDGLVRLLRDKSHYVAKLAAEALVGRADHIIAPALVERFLFLSEDGVKRDPACSVRCALALALGRLEYRAAEDAFVIGVRTVQPESVGGPLYDMGAQLRATCAMCLAEIYSSHALAEISGLLFD